GLFPCGYGPGHPNARFDPRIRLSAVVSGPALAGAAVALLAAGTRPGLHPVHRPDDLLPSGLVSGNRGMMTVLALVQLLLGLALAPLLLVIITRTKSFFGGRVG